MCDLEEENLLSGTGGARLEGLLGRESEVEVLHMRIVGIGINYWQISRRYAAVTIYTYTTSSN